MTDGAQQPDVRAIRTADPRIALRGFLALDAGVRLLIWAVALAAATTAMTKLGAWPAAGQLTDGVRGPWLWAMRICLWVILFNVMYVLELVVLRLAAPTPREGVYSIAPGARPDRQLLWSCLLAVLTKARFEPPFPGYLVFHVASLPPLCWMMSAVFGPRSRSAHVTDPRILDPHFVTLGRNVVIGFNTTVAGHYQERDTVTLKRTIIEDDVLIGGHAVIFGGVRIRNGSMIGAGAVVLPGTVVGPNEFWAGVPAKKIRELSAR